MTGASGVFYYECCVSYFVEFPRIVAGDTREAGEGLAVLSVALPLEDRPSSITGANSQDKTLNKTGNLLQISLSDQILQYRYRQVK